MIVGLDFGTTNSAVALPSPGGEVVLASLDGAGTYRSVLYFDPEERGPDRRPLAFGGREAIDRFHEGDGGRLLQSLKSHLASRVFSATSIFGVRFTLEELVARLVRLLLAKAELSRVRAVVGRPVHFVSDEADDEGDARAEGRLTGGTSLVPLVRHEFGRRFGAHKLVGGEELTTVASGLALRALEELG